MNLFYVWGFGVLLAISSVAIIGRWMYLLGKASGNAEGWRRGYRDGYNDAKEALITARKRALADAGRVTEPRPDAVGNARITPLRIRSPHIPTMQK